MMSPPATTARVTMHPPWTATSRGLETSLRRLAILEPVYSPGSRTC